MNSLCKTVRGPLLGTAFTIILLAGCARSTEMIRGEEARKFIGSKTRLLEPGEYTYLAIRDPHEQNLLAAIFNSGGGSFRLIKAECSPPRRSGTDSFVLLLDSADGDPGSVPVSADLTEIEANHLSPIVILDTKSTERAIVYRPGSLPVTAVNRPEEKILRVEIGRRAPFNQGKIDYSLSLKETVMAPGGDKNTEHKEEETMSEIKTGDLVRWEAGDKIRVGVVKSVDDDGTCQINVPTTQGSRQETIRTERLEAITSTVESKEE